ncbi:hypothetical protein Barb4_05104 [Bacteroidales bacterium Barb4]|nr:hypothetical protein Barb4_05104 [Bacteroidales bacterium Barb4]
MLFTLYKSILPFIVNGVLMFEGVLKYTSGLLALVKNRNLSSSAAVVILTDDGTVSVESATSTKGLTLLYMEA